MHLQRPQSTANRKMVVCRVQPSDKTLKELNDAIANANKICHDKTKTNQDCIVAWDAVSDISTGFYSQREKENEIAKKDVLDAFCEEFPDALECRIYDN